MIDYPLEFFDAGQSLLTSKNFFYVRIISRWLFLFSNQLPKEGVWARRNLFTGLGSMSRKFFQPNLKQPTQTIKIPTETSADFFGLSEYMTMSSSRIVALIMKINSKNKLKTNIFGKFDRILPIFMQKTFNFNFFNLTKHGTNRFIPPRNHSTLE